jgi:hypothetical protein
VSGFHRDKVAAVFSRHATKGLVAWRRNFGRSSLNCVMKTNRWSEGLAPQNLAASLFALRNNMFCKIYCLYSDNCPRMSRMSSEYCVLSPSFQWPAICQRKRTRSTLLVPCSQQVKINLGKWDSASQRTSPNLLIHSERISQTTIWSKLSLSSLLTVSSR